MLNQRLQQKLLQKLSPQQILLMKLLQIPSIGLEQRIKQEVEENPALEEGEEVDDVANDSDQDDIDSDDSMEDDSNDEFDLEDYMDEDDIPEYKLHSSNKSADDEQKDIPLASGISFHEMLSSQLGMFPLEDDQRLIAEYIIGNIDDSGYLQRELENMVDDLAFSQNINTNEKELEKILRLIQTFDPSGIGGRNLQECLLIQLDRKEETHQILLAKKILKRGFNEFTKKHYEKIIKKLKITEEELKDAINEILKLNPKPGNSLSDTIRTNQYIIPDFIIHIKDNELELSLNSKNTPELRLSRTYSDMLESYAISKGKKTQSDKEAIIFIKQKIDSAKWFIDAIRQRQNTLFITMNAIMNYQKAYFITGDETKLKPMILKDIAEIVNLDISTISRVANSKYVQTPFGTFLLKSFFSESMQTDSGEEVSTREIKKILSNCVESESKTKPLTDEQLAGILKEKGYNIARRTVAKYREQLNISVARLRKQL
ncbi:MAG: RNA polymerase factor sigma-54 [Bacteroidales bacterium]|nr:RNA polymerase factor sigma-54 [Bacteroidales bacterium]